MLWRRRVWCFLSPSTSSVQWVPRQSAATSRPGPRNVVSGSDETERMLASDWSGSGQSSPLIGRRSAAEAARPPLLVHQFHKMINIMKLRSPCVTSVFWSNSCDIYTALCKFSQLETSSLRIFDHIFTAAKMCEPTAPRSMSHLLSPTCP